MSRRFRLLCAAAAVAAAAVSASASLSSSGAAGPGGTIALDALPGPGWVLPLQDEQLGRVAKAFAAAQEACAAPGGRQAMPASVHATFSSRLGRGLSLAGSRGIP